MRKTHQTILAEHGVALIVVLLILAVIAALVFEFCHNARVKYQLAENTLHSYQALYCAEAGLTMTMTVLEQSSDLWSDEKLARVLFGGTPMTVGSGQCTTTVVAERGKISVNGLVTADGKPVRARIEQMLRLIDALNAQRKEREPISYSLVAALVDWIDPDDEVTVLPYVQGANAGAEEGYYRNLDKPYHCKNGPVETLSELLLVKGMTRGIFYGQTDAGEAGFAGLEECLTVYGDGPMNINDAPATLLQTLSEQIDAGLAQSIVKQRPYRSVGELASVPGMTPEVLRAIRGQVTVQPGGEYYTVTARGVVGNCVRTVRLALRRDLRGGQVTPLIRWEI